MADPNVDAIVQQVLSQVPLYNPVIAGIPLYLQIIMIETAFVFFGLALFKVYFWDPMQPVMGFRLAALNNTPQSIIHGMNGQIWMESTQYVAGIFKSMKLPLMWIITAPVSGQMGRVNTTELSDDWNIVHNIDIDYAIVAMARSFNKFQHEQHPDLKIEDLISQNLFIHDWNTFELHLMDGSLDAHIPNGMKLPPFRVVDLHEVRRYLPKWKASHFAGYINQEIAKREKGNKDEGKDFLKYAIIGGAIIVVSAILAYLILHVGK